MMLMAKMGVLQSGPEKVNDHNSWQQQQQQQQCLRKQQLQQQDIHQYNATLQAHSVVHVCVWSDTEGCPRPDMQLQLMLVYA